MTNTIYTKSNALQTRGLAIISMVCLHLFCRKGVDVFGTPVLWTSNGVPLVYWLGFVSGICVPLYSICAGYAQELLFENGKGGYINNLKRCFKLIANLWIVLLLFTFISCFVGIRNDMPTNWTEFFQQALLIKYTNGAWWYLRTYIIIMLIPPKILLWPVLHINCILGLVFCLGLSILGYIIRRFNLLSDDVQSIWIVKFLISYLCIFSVLPFIYIGAFICKEKIFEKLNSYLLIYSINKKNIILILILLTLFVIVCIFEKSILIDLYALIVFLVFNLIYKNEIISKFFLFFGFHSTNIWLIHMFYYNCLFKGLIQQLKYPLFMFISMMLLCIFSSYIIIGIQTLLNKILAIIKY